MSFLWYPDLGGERAFFYSKEPPYAQHMAMITRSRDVHPEWEERFKETVEQRYRDMGCVPFQELPWEARRHWGTVWAEAAFKDFTAYPTGDKRCIE